MTGRQRAMALVVAVFSTGWLVPLWWGIALYLDFWHSEGWPLLLGQHPLNSLDFIATSRECIGWSVLWLGAVMAFWSYVGFAAFLDRARSG